MYKYQNNMTQVNYLPQDLTNNLLKKAEYL